jgi:hypothetical protein
MQVHPFHHRCALFICLASETPARLNVAVARLAAFARRQTGRAISRKCPTKAVNLTPTQPHQRRSGINREPIIRKINHHAQPGQFPIDHLNRHRTSPRTFQRQCASANVFYRGRV